MIPVSDRSGAEARDELRFLRETLRPYRSIALAAVVLQLGTGVLLLAMPWFAGQVARSLLQGAVPGRLLLAWLLILAIGVLLEIGNGFVTGKAGARAAADLGGRIYDHLQSLPMRWHQGQKRGEVLALLSNDVWRISGFLIGVLVPVLPLLFTCVGALVLLLRIEPRVGFAVTLAVPLFTLLVRLLTRGLRPLANERMRADAVKSGIAEQNLAVLPLIKAFTREDQESARYGAQSDKLMVLETRLSRIESTLAPLVRWLAAALVIGLLWLGGGSVASGAIGAPELVSLLLYGMLLTQPVSQLAGMWGQIQHARGSAQRLMAALAEAPEPDDGVRELQNVSGDLAFEAVGFAYPGRPALFQALDWRIRAGETVAITGVNGAGKSTLAHLLLRFADPDAGRISLDGIDLRELRLANLRSHIGLVSQHVLLLNATVAENIGYGRRDATREQIEQAARAAHAYEFIGQLPQGYDTLIGDDGLRLSGGQRQRISLARALLKDPAVLILDEATAMFDPEGERGFIAECHALLHSRTVIIISHRPASQALADRVLRLEHGELREVERLAGA